MNTQVLSARARPSRTSRGPVLSGSSARTSPSGTVSGLASVVARTSPRARGASAWAFAPQVWAAPATGMVAVSERPTTSQSASRWSGQHPAARSAPSSTTIRSSSATPRPVSSSPGRSSARATSVAHTSKPLTNIAVSSISIGGVTPGAGWQCRTAEPSPGKAQPSAQTSSVATARWVRTVRSVPTAARLVGRNDIGAGFLDWSDGWCVFGAPASMPLI